MCRYMVHNGSITYALLRKLCQYQGHACLSHSTVYRRKLLADLQLINTCFCIENFMQEF